MANFKDQIKEIQTLLSSTAATDKSQKPVAYSTLLHLQEQSSSATCDLPLIQWLADASLCLLPLILTDIFDDDEEISAQALKCLGFMIYHPTLVATFSSDDANLIVNSLTKVIITTKIKAVCNLGVWCLSVQQFPSIYLAANFNSLLRAIVHALDNPLGSLSTTFEATQAVIKLAAQLNEKMRDSSNIWAPPIYRRSLSADKRVRDISGRCLLKIRSTICPPSVSLSKAIVIDLKGTLLPGMKELLNHGLKIQALQAWGWFIRLLGPYAVKNRHLVNEMLKIPEQTFPDADPQVQIASLVAWEGLIDALIGHGRTCNGNDSGAEGQTHSKSIKLIMAPIIGIMSSRCDQSVYSSCLNTWCYLLHTLDASVNSPSLIKTAWEPVFDAVFRVTPDSKSIRGWITCLDLFEDFVLAKGRELESDLSDQVNYQLSAKIPTTGSPIPSEQPWLHYPIKWMPCDLNKLDFCFKVIENFLSRGRGVNDTEVKCLVHDSALRIFRSVMKGVRSVLNNSSLNYDEILLCLNKTFELLKVISESIISENTGNNHLRLTALQFVGAVVEEIEPSILGSPLYKVALDLKCFDNSANMTKHGEVIGVQFKVYMDMVSPIFYLLNLYFCGVFNSTFDAPGAEFIMQDACRYVKFVLCSYEPSEIIHGIMGLMYKHVGFDYLKVWVAISKGLIEYVGEVKDISLLTLGSDMSKCSAPCQLLFYPFSVCLVCQERPTIEQCTGIQVSADVSFQSHRQLELELVFDVWKALYACVNHANRSENSTSSGLADQLALALNGCLDEDMKVLECGSKLNPSNSHQNHDLLFLYGNAVICVLEDIQISAISSTGSIDRDDGDQNESSVNILRLTARFMTLARTVAETSLPPAISPLIPRVFSTLVHFVGHLHMKKDVLSLIQIISNPLLQWMTSPEEPCKAANCQLQLLWTEILNRLQKSRPPLTFDSSFLELQAPLLERTLIHPNLSISNPTISFWNSTYATEKLDYPQSLIPVLDKLSRQGKISLFKRGMPYHSRLGAPPRYQVSTVTQHRSSKRVELSEDIGKKGSLGLKRKSELTEHQKEVRRAQQGRERDCSGHGPGIRTYTALDFSQGNEESQDSQDVRDAEAILELLRRDS